MARWGLFEVGTNAASKQEFLLRPDLGRSLMVPGKAEIKRLCPAGADIQVAIGDGLSAAAVVVQVPALSPSCTRRRPGPRAWRFGQPVFIRHCRVGVLNDLAPLGSTRRS